MTFEITSEKFKYVTSFNLHLYSLTILNSVTGIKQEKPLSYWVILPSTNLILTSPHKHFCLKTKNDGLTRNTNPRAMSVPILNVNC